MSKRPRSWRRWLGRGLALGLGAIMVGALTSPWWLGVAVRRIGGAYGVTVGAYSQVGYTRWQLDDITVRESGVVVRLDHLEGPQPLLWWWQRAEASALEAGNWTVEIDRTAAGAEPGSSPSSPSTPSSPSAPSSLSSPPRVVGWSSLLKLLGRGHALASTWLPPLQVGAGAVGWAGAAPWFTVERGRATALRAELSGLKWRQEAVDLAVDWAEPETWQVTAQERGHGVRLRAVLGARASEGEVVWAEQTARWTATFGEHGWWPEDADASASDWRVPGARLGWGEWVDELAGAAHFSWRDGRGAVDVQVTGTPPAGSARPALALAVRATGDLAAVTIEQCDITAPGVEAALDGPFTWQFRQGPPVTASTFRLAVDLAQWPDAPGTGRVSGEVTLTPRDEDWPEVMGKLQVDALVWAEAPALNLILEGSLTGPTWRLDRLVAEDAGGSRLEAQAAGQWPERRIEEGAWSGTVARASVARWLPAAWNFERFAGQGTVTGVWPELIQQGTAEVAGLQQAQLQRMTATVAWQSQGRSAQADVDLQAGSGEVKANLTIDPEKVAVTQLVVTHQEAKVAALTAPVVWTAARPQALGPVALAGPGVEIASDASSLAAGAVRVQARDPDLSWWSDWFLAPLPLQKLRSGALTASWSEVAGLTFAVQAEGAAAVADLGAVDFAIDATGEPSGLVVRAFRFGRGERTFARFQGTLPWHVDGPANWGLTIDAEGALEVAAELSPNPAFWRAVGETTGFTVQAPTAVVALKGTWAHPTGEGTLAVQRITVDSRWGGRTWPDLQRLQARVVGDPTGLRLESLAVELEGSVVRMSGALPLTPADWQQLREAPLVYLRERGEARIEVPGIELASVAKVVPDYLVPVGRLSGDVSFAPGGKMEGSVTLVGATSRPLGPLGVLQEIGAQLSFHERTIELSGLRALMGGQPVELAGVATWSAGAAAPVLDLTLRGSNLPLVRRTGLLLRGDLDLRVQTNDDGSGRVSGTVGLHNGLMLTDVRSLVPKGGADRRNGRPPYFAVEQKPFAAWALDVAVAGDHFMRLRTPVLNGVASIDMLLTGTLGTPRARGEITLEEGTVRLPFANFTVDEAYARLTAASPYEPQIHLSGTSKRLGYDLKMELSGTADDPRLELSSDPGLPASDVMLLVMAGEAPKEEVSYSESQRALQLGVFFSRELVGEVLGFSGGDRLSVTAGERLSRRGRETYRFEYELDDRWTAVGEYDEFDYYNAGLKWRWLPRPKKPAKTEEAAHEAP